MGFKLEKGGSFNIQKSISAVLAGLGWNASASTGKEFDLDAHAFGLSNGKHYSPAAGGAPLALSYANGDETEKAPDVGPKAFKTKDGSMTHLGDNRTGDGDGDDEQIKVSLDKLPPAVDEVAVWVTIYDAAKRGQSFDQVDGAYVRVLDAFSQEELCKYNLAEKFAGAASVHVGSFKRVGDAWSFMAVGEALQGELQAVLAKY